MDKEEKELLKQIAASLTRIEMLLQNMPETLLKLTPDFWDILCDAKNDRMYYPCRHPKRYP